MGKVYDPNYNPGFFGWMWDGIKNPLDALNSFENNVLAPAANNISNFLAPVQKPVDNFLTTNPVGQAVAPVLQTGAGWSSDSGFHAGMGAPGIPADQIDYDAIVDNAVSDFNKTQPALAGPQSNQYFYNNVAVSKPEYDRLMGYDPAKGNADQTGWSTANNSPAKGVNRLSDGTEYTTSVVNGQTVYTVVNSPKNASANGKTLDERNFDNLLSGKAYNPFTPPAATAAAANPPSQMTTGQPSTGGQTSAPAAPNLTGEWWKDPAIMAGMANLIGAGTAIAAGNTQSGAATEAARIQAEAAEKARQLQEQQFNTVQENWKPWREAGQAALGKLQTFDQDNPAFGMSQFQQDPGYTFRLNEGMKALQNSAAARGGLLSGNSMKAIQNYGQESASQEYQNAFNRYQTERGQRLNNLQSLAGVGQTAIQQVGSAGQSYANNAGQALIGGAGALAQGQTNAANANASGYMGAGNALTNALGGYLNYNQSQNFINALRGGF